MARTHPPLLLLAAAALLAAAHAAPLSSLATLAGDAALAALRADARSGAALALGDVHAGSMVITTGSEQSITLDIDGAPYKLTMHELDAAAAEPGARAAAAPPTPAVAAVVAAAAAVSPNGPASLPLAAAADAASDGRPPPLPASVAPAAMPSLALAPFTLAGPLTIDLASTGSLAMDLPSRVDIPAARRVRVPASAALRVVGAASARLASPLPLGAPPPGWLASAYGVAVDGVAAGGDLAPGAGALAAAAGARAAAERAPPTVVVDLASPGARLEVVGLADGEAPAPLRARLREGGTVDLVPRRKAPSAGDGDDDDDASPGPPPLPAATWAWPLAGVSGSRLARADAALAELLAAARAARGGDAAAAAPTLRVSDAGADAVAFVRIRLTVTRTPLEGGNDTAPAVAGASADEQWEALVRVAPPTTPGGPPRVAALRAERVATGAGAGAGVVTSVTVGPGAALAAVGNATAAPDDHDYEFVYPPAAFVL